MGYTDNAKVFSERTAFGEVKTGETQPGAAWTFTYNINDDIVNSSVTNGGTVTHDAPFAVISSGTNPAGTAELHTHNAVRYHPGVGGIVRFTAIFSPGQPNSYQYIGIANSLDAIAIGYQNDVFGFLVRNNGSDTFIPLENRTRCTNVFDGFDPQKLNVYQIQYQWLGGGEIRFFIEDPGIGGFVLVHEFRFANTATTTSVRNPMLPLAAMVGNTGNTSDIVLKTPSGMAGNEGRVDGSGMSTPYAGIETKAVSNTEIPILSIRNKTTYQGRDNHVSLSPKFFTFAAIGNKVVEIRLYFNPILTGAIWGDIAPNNSPAEADISATTFTGGKPVYAGAVAPNSSDILRFNLDDDLKLPPGFTATFTAKTDSPASGTEVTIGITFLNNF